MDVHLELYRNGVGRDTITVNTICEPMKIVFVLIVLGSNVSSFLKSLHFRIKKRTILCMGFFGLVVSHRRLVWMSGSASSLGCDTVKIGVDRPNKKGKNPWNSG